ncbi:MAG TPA: hypothetical protein VFS83_17515 [Ktedonobacterales bacterium]|nr:hypothetical protein [Ktedonobacterales bacterium]
MERYLRPLAIAAVIVEVCAAAFTVPTLFAYLDLLRFQFPRELITNQLAAETLTITGLALTFIMGVLAIVVAAQRGHRPWSIAFVILLALFAYSPLLLSWVLQSQSFIYDAARFNVDTTAFTLVELSNLIVPAIVLAVVVFVYSLRYRQMSSQGQDTALEIERGKIDNARASH